MNNHNQVNQLSPQPPALRIRFLRSLYGERGLTIAELADLAGVPRQMLIELESATRLRSSHEALIRIAFALQVPLDELFDAEHLRRVRSQVATHRAQQDENMSKEDSRCRDDDAT